MANYHCQMNGKEVYSSLWEHSCSIITQKESQEATRLNNADSFSAAYPLFLKTINGKKLQTKWTKFMETCDL